jgi:hypothetical protein
MQIGEPVLLRVVDPGARVRRAEGPPQQDLRDRASEAMNSDLLTATCDGFERLIEAGSRPDIGSGHAGDTANSDAGTAQIQISLQPAYVFSGMENRDRLEAAFAHLGIINEGRMCAFPGIVVVDNVKGDIVRAYPGIVRRKNATTFQCACYPRWRSGTPSSGPGLPTT